MGKHSKKKLNFIKFIICEALRFKRFQHRPNLERSDFLGSVRFRFGGLFSEPWTWTFGSVRQFPEPWTWTQVQVQFRFELGPNLWNSGEVQRRFYGQKTTDTFENGMSSTHFSILHHLKPVMRPGEYLTFISESSDCVGVSNISSLSLNNHPLSSAIILLRVLSEPWWSVSRIGTE